METAVRELTTDGEWAAAVRLLGQLWTDRDADEIRSWRADDDYRLLGRFADGDLVGVAGVACKVLIRHERTAWVNDLVVDESRRREGHGEALLDAVADWAAEHDCETVGLVSHVTNDAATAFYEETAMQRFGRVYTRDPS